MEFCWSAAVGTLTDVFKFGLDNLKTGCFVPLVELETLCRCTRRRI